MRGFRSDFENVFRGNQSLTTRLIIINVIVFLGFLILKFSLGLFPQIGITPGLIDKSHLVSRDFKTFITHLWTLLFHPFTSRSFFSLLFNVILLYWFGNKLAGLIGEQKTIVSYISGALFSIVFFMVLWGVFRLLNADITTNSFIYGASAGAFALMFGYIALNPESDIMIFTFRLKARWLAIILLAISIMGSPAQGVVDLGGGVFGYAQMKLLRSGINLTYWIERFYMWSKGGFRVQKATFTKKNIIRSNGPGTKPYQSRSFDSNPTQEEIDFLLDKINKGGYDSLSEEEKQRLHQASQKID